MRDFLLGAVAYDAKVVPIWEGFRTFFIAAGLPFDFVLYSNYERQVEAHLRGEIDVAWNSPLAWIETERAAKKLGRVASTVAMRDTDRDLTSVVIVRADSPVKAAADLRGKAIGVGAADSPQATLIPLASLADLGVEGRVVRHDVLAGKHGDHIGGERDAVKALIAGTIDAACVIDGNRLAFSREGLIGSTGPTAVRVVHITGAYDHCNFTVLDNPHANTARFTELLLGMSYDDPALRPLLDMEGLKKWLPGRVSGYALLERAVDRYRYLDDWLVRFGELMHLDLGDLGLDEGAHLLIARGLAESATVDVSGTSENLPIDLPAWCRAKGHACVRTAAGFAVTRGTADRTVGAERAGSIAAPVAHAPARWGLAARGALVEAGAPELDLPLADRSAIWADEAARLYAQAAAAQWDPATAIPWDAPADHPPEVEDAIVQIFTYLIENETAALLVPARFLGRLHPHFREVMQLLAIQTADEARHIDVFTRRATLRRGELALSTAGGQASLASLFDEPEFAIASFLLSVLGEGSFLSLLWFIRDHAPDLCTREVARLAAQDEARHVAFGLAHLSRHVGEEPALRDRLAAAIERRHAALAHTSGLNAEVFDALILLAAGGWAPADLRRGHAAVVALQKTMDDGRRQRLIRLGFEATRAEALSALHTRNFM